MCSNKDFLTRAEYDAVQTLLAIIAGYEMSYEEVKESELLSTHFKYAYLLTHCSDEIVNAFVSMLDNEQRYSLILLNKIFVKLAD